MKPYICAATLERRQGNEVNIQGFTLVTMAASESDARGQMMAAISKSCPRHSVLPGSRVDRIPDDFIRDAFAEIVAN